MLFDIHCAKENELNVVQADRINNPREEHVEVTKIMEIELKHRRKY